MSAAGTDNANADSNNVIATIKDTKWHVHVVTLSAKDNQKLSKCLSKGLKISVYLNEYKTKSGNKNTTNECRYFLESNFVGVNRLFVSVYINQDVNAKRFNVRKYYSPKSIIENYNITINGKIFYDQPIDSDMKRCKEIRKLIIGQGEDCTTGCLLGYDYIRNHNTLTEADLSRQKESDADPKAIQQTECVGQLKNADGINADGTQNMFVLATLEKIEETRLTFSQGNVTVLKKVTNYQEKELN